MAAAVKTSSYASATGESMTRIAANEGGAAIDAATGIVPAGAKFESSQLSSGATYDNAANIVAARIGANTNFAVFEMNLTDSNNTAIHQLDGKINVTMPIPADMTPADGNILVVYRIEDDGTMTRCDTATANGCVTFATDHFSTYVLVEEPASGASAGTKATSPKTAESATSMILLMITAMSLAGAAVVSKKRYNN
jgi:LPXTG-motif cell wall-anchored protein